MYQQTQVDLSPGLNAFAQGMAARQQRQQAQAVGNAFSQGNYQQAADTAFKQGNLDAGIKIQEFAAKASAGEREAALQSASTFYNTAGALLGMPYESRRQALMQAGPMLNIDPAQLQSFDPTDENLRLIAAQSKEFQKALAGNIQNYSLGENDSRVDAISGRQTIGEAGIRARELEAESNNIRRQQMGQGSTITLADGTVIRQGAPGSPQQLGAQRKVEDRGQRVRLITDTFDRAIEDVGRMTAGAIGSGLSRIPGTPAHDLKATIDTIAANIGFEEIQRMRDNSKTGGALGQVTEKEIAFLQSVLGSLSQSQSPDQLRANLERAKQEVQASWGRIQQAYEQDYGLPYQGAGPQAGGQQGESTPSPSAPDLSSMSDEELMRIANQGQ